MVSVTRWFFNIWPSTSMKTCLMPYKICQSKPQNLPNSKKNLKNCPRLRRFFQGGEFSPNLVTLLMVSWPFRSSDCLTFLTLRWIVLKVGKTVLSEDLRVTNLVNAKWSKITTVALYSKQIFSQYHSRLVN